MQRRPLVARYSINTEEILRTQALVGCSPSLQSLKRSEKTRSSVSLMRAAEFAQKQVGVAAGMADVVQDRGAAQLTRVVY